MDDEISSLLGIDFLGGLSGVFLCLLPCGGTFTFSIIINLERGVFVLALFLVSVLCSAVSVAG